MDLIQLYHRLRTRWWIVALTVLVCIVAAGAYLLHAKKIYSSRAVLQVQQQGGRLQGTTTTSGNDSISPEVLTTIQQNLTKQALLLRVIQAAHLAADPEFAPPKKDGTPYLDSELIEILQKKLSVELRRGTRLIDVTVEDEDPKRAQSLVNTFITQYSEQSFLEQLDSLKTSNDYLAGEVQKYWADLSRIHDALEKNDSSGLLEVASISQDEEVSGLQTRIHTEEASFASLKEVFMENHPRYIAAQHRLQELRDLQSAALLRSAERLENSYQNTKATENELITDLQQQREALRSDHPPVPKEVLAQQVESDHALYDAVLARMKQSPAPQGVNQNNIEIVAEPLVSAKPIRPRSTLVLVAAVLVGIVTGLALIIGQDYFNNAFTSVYDIETALGIPVLATVPKSHQIAQGREAVTEESNSFELEAFRTLRSAIHLQENKQGGGDAVPKDLVRNAVLFTSANSGEGKTSCAFNYAVMLSNQGLRTLLIDGDMRRATLTSLLMPGKKCVGLAEALAGQGAPLDFCQATRYENLSFLAAGGSNGRSGQILDSIKMGALLREIARQFDHVVIDSPPLNAVSDGLLIAPHILMNCLVIHAGVTPKTAVARACVQLKHASHGLIGAILNRVGTDSRATYEVHGYAKNYSYPYAKQR